MLSLIRAAALLLSLLLLGTGFAQPVSNAARAPRFSSVYTDLNTQCKGEYEPTDNGQDVPLICKGYGGYVINVGYSAWAAHIGINKPGDEASLPLAAQPAGYTHEKGRKIEWRMADGKPFAVIMRVSKYREREDGGYPYEAQYKTGESLRVKGLKGFEKIDHDLDVKTAANPNARAREMADEGYLQIKGKTQ